MDSSTPFAGVMEKKGHVRKTWKTRYFVLDGSQLAYYAAEGDARPKGAFAVVAFTDVPDRAGGSTWRRSPRANRIDVYGTGNRQTSVAALSAEDKTAWLAALGAGHALTKKAARSLAMCESRV